MPLGVEKYYLIQLSKKLKFDIKHEIKYLGVII